jgi:hypothetical protein
VPNDIWGWVHNMTLVTVELPPVSHSVIPLRSQCTLFSNISVYALPLTWQTKFLTHTKQNSIKNYVC